MNILLVCDQKIPALLYGGTERIVWWLGEELHKRGHKVSFLAGKGSYCNFADVHIYKPNIPLNDQIPSDVDFVHFHFPITEEVTKPYLSTLHWNSAPDIKYDKNTVFISRNHAQRHNSDTFVYNGLDFNEYGKVGWNMKREHFLFLGKARKGRKNVKGCIKIAKAIDEKLAVIGGRGLPFNKYVKYKGFIGGEKKSRVINQSKALLFPVLWHEPFGLAIVEAMYFGCPVFGSTYGSLPEIINNEVGFISNSYSEITNAAKEYNNYDRKRCHEYACDSFSVKQMTDGYLNLYERVLDGMALNQENPIHKANTGVRHEYPLEP